MQHPGQCVLCPLSLWERARQSHGERLRLETAIRCSDNRYNLARGREHRLLDFSPRVLGLDAPSPLSGHARVRVTVLRRRR
jgi:hypothetical protein